MTKLVAVTGVLEDERNPDIAIFDLDDSTLPPPVRAAIEKGLSNAEGFGGSISYDDWYRQKATPIKPAFPVEIAGFVMIWVGG
jgi:hypothetical protein